MALTVTRSAPQFSEEGEKKSRAVLDAWLARAMSDMKYSIQPKVIPIADETTHKVFPSDHFYGIYLPRFPHAVMPPKQLALETLVCVREDGAMETIRGNDDLRTFLAQRLAGIRDEGKARDAATVSLLLAGFGAKYGPYQLANPDVKVVSQDKHISASAGASVQAPSRGKIEVSIEFDADGRTTMNNIKITDSTRPGPP